VCVCVVVYVCACMCVVCGVCLLRQPGSRTGCSKWP
jgi:hypothetical protein